MSGQPSGNAGVATSRPTTNGNSNGGMSMVSQQRSNDSSAGPSTASVAQNGSMSQANLNNIVRPIISLWLYMWNSYVCYVVVKNYLLWSTQAFFFPWVFYNLPSHSTPVWLPYYEQAGVMIPSHYDPDPYRNYGCNGCSIIESIAYNLCRLMWFHIWRKISPSAIVSVLTLLASGD